MNRIKILRTTYYFVVVILWANISLYADMSERPQVCVLLGYPGSGKGTLAQSLNSDRYMQLSFGDILRNDLKNGSALALAYKDEIEMKKIEKIKFLPEEVVRNLLDVHLTKMLGKSERIVLDGYPKTVEQALYLENYFRSRGITAVYIYVNTKRSLLIDRVLGRITCTNCARVYNRTTRPPLQPDICDYCKSPLFVRGSDNEENQTRRIEFYEKTSVPLIEFYRKKGFLHELDNSKSLSEGRSQLYNILLKEGFIYEFK